MTYRPDLERFIISQSAIFRDVEGRVLVLKDTKGPWLLPGGCINVGENSLEGLIREVKEETGLDLDKVLSATDMVTWYEKDVAWSSVAFECTVKKTTPIILSNEHTEYRWITETELADIPFWHPNIGTRIKKVFEKYHRQ